MLVERPHPVVSQVTKIISERIREKKYNSDLRLPSEMDLADEFGVSRATVRSALGKLAAEGLVIRKQGDGTYVNEHIIDVPTRMGAMWDFIRLIENSGFEASTQLLSIKTRPVTEHEALALRAIPDSDAVALHRRFTANTKPVILASTTIPIGLFLDSDQPLQQHEGELPLRDLLWRKCRQVIAYAIINIESILPGEDTKQLLQKDDTSPLLKLEQVFYNNDNLPILFSESFYDDKTLGLRLVQTWS